MIAEGCEVGWTKGAAMGRGPPYSRDPKINAQLSHAPVVWEGSRRISTKMSEKQHPGRLVLVKSEQTHYAVGILGTEELEQLELRDSMNAVTEELDDVNLNDDDDNS